MNACQRNGRWVRVLLDYGVVIGWECSCGWVNVPDVQVECLQCRAKVPSIMEFKQEKNSENKKTDDR